MKKYSIFLVFIVLAACSRPAKNSTSNDPSLTLQDVKAEPVVAVTKITDQQKLLMKQDNSKSNLLPSTNLLLIDPNVPDDSKSRDAAVAALPAETKAELDRINANCKISQPNDVITGDTSGDAGTTKIENITASISGLGCTIDDQEQTKRTTLVESISATQTESKVTENKTVALKVTDNTLSTNSGIVTTNQDITTTLEKKLFGDGSSQINVEMTGKATIDHGQSNVDQMEIASRSVATKKSASEAPQRRGYMRVNITKGDIKAIIQVYNDGTTVSCYLNGVKMTPQQLSDQTGISVSLN